MTTIDALSLAQELIRCPSVTPADEGALDVLQDALDRLGFVSTRLPFSEPGTPDVDNLFAKFGDGSPHFCYAGHTDVVPAGDKDAWTVEPFAGQVKDGYLMGRGASDMKSAIAAFVAAVSRFLESKESGFTGSISLLITGDEEGPSINGTAKMLGWLASQGESLDHCLVGEPTNPQVLGEMIKIGRRGSLNGRLIVEGVQGHAAYPDLADNPVPKILAILTALTAKEIDQGNDHFQPSNLEITSVDVGNPTANVIPARAEALFNIRYNDEQTSEGLQDWLRSECNGVIEKLGGSYSLEFSSTGDVFITKPSAFSDLISDSIEKTLGRRPVLSTSGGTSDARFIKDICPVAEFGLIGATAHKVDEKVALSDIEGLTNIYGVILDGYFAL